MNLGKTGVNLFFCISGFLIVGILHESRKRIETRIAGSATELKNFYAKRLLRLSPPYFAYLLVALGLTLAFPKHFDYSGFLFHFTYTTNFWVGFVEKSWSNIFGHFWSLAVEEQYYLLTAPLLVFIPSAKHRAVMMTFVAIGVCSLATLVIHSADPLVIYTFPTVNFILISLGGLMALSRGRIGMSGLAVGLACLFIESWPVLIEGLTAQLPMQLLVPSHMLITMIGCYLVIGYIVRNQQEGILMTCLEWKPLKFIGKLSYGIYVYHVVIPNQSIGGTFLPKLWGGEYNFAVGYAIGTAVYFFLTILLAYASWIFLEAPALRLKSRFHSASVSHVASHGVGLQPERA